MNNGDKRSFATYVAKDDGTFSELVNTSSVGTFVSDMIVRDNGVLVGANRNFNVSDKDITTPATVTELISLVHTSSSRSLSWKASSDSVGVAGYYINTGISVAVIGTALKKYL